MGFYLKTTNEILASHRLATRIQYADGSLDEYHQALIVLAKECDFITVTMEQYRNEYIRNSFNSELHSPIMRQRVLENST